ncbi:small integral membrane protein 5 isoform X3 [Lates japonicus]|uniref:Small integral membrane protein 5 isoform X3 n=1 Tax=Lates japonicus TaxID=270547 RepID=A0AAD3MPC1_LATJO|nr:small integral membrane protein 5 isoform X3 [Lates japonicus]
MAVESISEQQKPTSSSPEDWVEWFLFRLHQEPWALGGVVVIGVFVLGTLSLVVFALLYGCCCGPAEENPKRRQKQKKPKKKDGVI